MGLSPFWDWKTIETEHFRVTFPPELVDVANKSANYLEEAHKILSYALYWSPTFKVQVLVVDNEDAANGLTSAVGRFGMVFIATPPDNWFSTAYYDDWLRLLAIHEYTHFLNMDPTRGIWEIFRYAFGDILLPNSIWPVWMLEGLAVYMETRYTKSGRGRSPYYDMVLRAAVEADVLDTAKFITLDKINGPDPYYPGGEVPYLFGYQLMKQVAQGDYKKELGDYTADRGSPLKDGDDALGKMSIRSSGRIPFFINGNLENITGKDWYQFWDEWVQETRVRAHAQLQKIKSQPITSYEPVTQGGYQTLGSAVSPDGKWIAYTQDTLDHRMSLYIKNLETGEVRNCGDKLLGAHVSFTSDSQAVLISRLQRKSLYYLFSDLAYYSIREDKTVSLSDGLRARDPAVSPDGKQVVFTLTENISNVLAIAPLERDEAGGYSLGKTERLYTPAKYDHLASPVFTPDGKKIIFSFHPMGVAREDLMVFDLDRKKATPLVSDGYFNRFPAVHPNGDIYFVSDRTGVDNIFRVHAPNQAEQRTNLTTGLSFATFSPSGKLYASTFSYRGWDLSQVSLSQSAISSTSVTLPPRPTPKIDSQSENHASQTQHAVQDYSIYPSILPRQWAPIVLLRNSGAYLGGQVLGFDAVDRHRYVLGLAYDTQVKKSDWVGVYSNRSFGVDLTFLSSQQTTQLDLLGNGEVLDYTRKSKYSFAVSYPFLWTYSSLTPSLSFNAERSFIFAPSLGPSEDPIAKSRYIPSADANLVYAELESSRLAITPEGGRVLQLSTRSYFGLETPTTVKGLFKGTEYIETFKHMVLVPSVAASAVSHYSETYALADVLVQGRTSGLLFNSLASDDLDQIVFRGYPDRTYFVKSAAVGALDYRFPLLRIFQGWGTHPAFLENLFGFVFAESAYFPASEPGAQFLPSYGGGLRLSSTLFVYLPLIFSLEYHKGTYVPGGGAGEVFFQIGAGNFTF